MKRALLLTLALAGCLPTGIPQNRAGMPMTLPVIDGRASVVTRAPRDYSVSRTQTTHGFEFRVTRLGRDFDYSEGVMAKKAAEAWCQKFNRSFSASAMGRFSQPNAWVFDGDCA
jgi:hypothetical protein